MDSARPGSPTEKLESFIYNDSPAEPRTAAYPGEDWPEYSECRDRM
jgi:hypothetical protein